MRGSIEALPKVKTASKEWSLEQTYDWFTKLVRFAPPITANLNARATYFSRVFLLEPKQCSP